MNIFKTPLKHFIKESHELVLLSKSIDWDSLEESLSIYYTKDNGRPGVPIRLISGIIMLKRIYNESDESVLNRWTENPYWQYFTGETYFNHELPFDRTELIKFRKRIGEEGSEEILKLSILLFPKKEVQEKEVLIDTTVQGKGSKNKIYNIHQPHVKCIAKGKEAKKFEFGNKTSIVKTMKSGIIVGAMAFTENIYDGDTLEPQLQQTERLIRKKPKAGIVDRGYRGRKLINGVKIIIPKRLTDSATSYQRQKMRKFFRARAGIEPVIGHLKQDHRMSRNYLRDNDGDKINTILAATGFNLRKMLQRLKAEALNSFWIFWNYLVGKKLELKISV